MIWINFFYFTMIDMSIVGKVMKIREIMGFFSEKVGVTPLEVNITN